MSTVDLPLHPGPVFPDKSMGIRCIGGAEDHKFFREGVCDGDRFDLIDPSIIIDDEVKDFVCFPFFLILFQISHFRVEKGDGNTAVIDGGVDVFPGVSLMEPVFQLH